MNIAILGATSQIAKDLIISFAKYTRYDCTLFGRDPTVIATWLNNISIDKCYSVKDYVGFGVDDSYDVILNFIGVGSPSQAKKMGSAILDITYQYDGIVLEYLKSHEKCKYLFLSSGAVYGGDFDVPVSFETEATFPINNLSETNWYAISKMYAEARHRALPELNIVDIRIFNYFSHTQEVSARFLITDILRAIRDKTVLVSSPEYIVRDFLHPLDFYQLINVMISKTAGNLALDCYSLAPIDKSSLLIAMKEQFGLRYEITEAFESVNATGIKSHYYSKNTRASDFGYQPSLTSLEGVTLEMNIILSNITEAIKGNDF